MGLFSSCLVNGPSGLTADQRRGNPGRLKIEDCWDFINGTDWLEQLREASWKYPDDP